MSRRMLALFALGILLVAGTSMAQPVKFNLVPIADDFPNIHGTVSIECNTITGTVFTVSLSNLPLNNFDLVLHGNAREDLPVGTIHVEQRGGETVAVFRLLIDCPIPNYDELRLMNGTRLIMFGSLH